MMAYFLAIILFIGLYCFAGIGLTQLVCPTALRRYAPFLFPVVGYCLVTLPGWYCFRSGLPGTDSYALLLLIPPLILAIIWLGVRKRLPKAESPMPVSELLGIVGVVCAGLILLSIPFLVHGLISLSVGNNDIADSAKLTRFLKEWQIGSSQGFLGQTDVIRRLVEQWIFGGPFATAWFSSLTGLQPYQVQSAGLIVFAVLALPLVYALAEEWFGYGKHSGLMVASLYAFNAMMLYVVYNGFQGQVFAMTLMLALYLIHVKALPLLRFDRQTAGFFVLAVLLNWGLSVTYSHMLFFTYGPFGLFIILSSIQAKAGKRALRWIAFSMLALAATFLLSPYRALMVWQQIMKTSQAQVGWFVPFAFPNVVLGLVADRSNLRNMHIALHLIFAIPLLMLLVWGLVKAYRNQRQAFIAACACLVTVCAGYCSLAFMGRTDLGWGGYKSFKFLSFFLPLVVCSWMLWIRGQAREDRITRRVRRVAACIMAFLVIGSGIAASVKAARRCKIVTADMVALGAIEEMPTINSVNIHSRECWDILWQEYFLMGKKLYFAYSAYADHEVGPLLGDWDLWKKSDLYEGGYYIYPGAIAYQNNSYVLIKHNTIKLDEQ